MTEFMPLPIEASGRFQYDFLDRFWISPYLIPSGEEIAGFALVVDQCPLTGEAPCWFMAEFFVLRAHRGRGVGQAALNAALTTHPGRWHIGVPLANRAALLFWAKALQDHGPAIRELHFDGDDWRLYEFDMVGRA